MSHTPLPQPLYDWSFAAIGTQWWIGIYESVDVELLQQLQVEIETVIADFDASFSRFKQESWLVGLSRRAGTYALPPHGAQLFALYRQFYDATDGFVTPLIGQLLNDSGYDANYSFKPKQLRHMPNWDDVMQVSDNKLVTQQPVELDFGALGKGYLVDLLCVVMQRYGVGAYCVDGSGDMRVSGLSTALRVGMEQPHNPEQAIGIIELTNAALCASAPWRRAWQQWHHILDPSTRQPTISLAAVWAVADTCALADGLTTALFFTEPERLATYFSFEYALLSGDADLQRSADFPATIFTAGYTSNRVQ